MEMKLIEGITAFWTTYFETNKKRYDNSEIKMATHNNKNGKLNWL